MSIPPSSDFGYTGAMSFFPSSRIYLDYAGATPVNRRAARATAEAYALIGNPSAIHQEGVLASKALGTSRDKLARELGCTGRELVFVSGGTEANNLAIIGTLKARQKSGLSIEGTHWIVSAIEHPSVLDCFGEVERLGGQVSFADPNSGGIIGPEKIQNLMRPETVFVSVGWANSEIGVIQPLAAIARVIREHEEKYSSRVYFHSDAVHAPVYKGTSVHSLGLDLCTFDSAKIYGPRGIGALYVGPHVELSPLFHGGGQERGLRPGTENIALVAGLAEAMQVIARNRAGESRRIEALRDAFSVSLRERIPSLVFNGDTRHMLPNIVNVSVPNIQSEYLTLALDHEGVAVSTKSACREGEAKRSHVIEALGGEQWRAENMIRFSLGSGTTSKELKKAAEIFAKLIHKMQKVGS